LLLKSPYDSKKLSKDHHAKWRTITILSTTPTKRSHLHLWKLLITPIPNVFNESLTTFTTVWYSFRYIYGETDPRNKDLKLMRDKRKDLTQFRRVWRTSLVSYFFKIFFRIPKCPTTHIIGHSRFVGRLLGKGGQSTWKLLYIILRLKI